MTIATLPQRKPAWLRSHLSALEQRRDMIHQAISQLLTTKATKGLDTPAPVLRALDATKEDLAEVNQQLKVLNAGWDALHPKT